MNELAPAAALERRRIIHMARVEADNHGEQANVLHALSAGLGMTRQEWTVARDSQFVGHPEWFDHQGLFVGPGVAASATTSELPEEEEEDEECQHDDHYTCCGYCETCDEHVCDDCTSDRCDQDWCHDCNHECS